MSLQVDSGTITAIATLILTIVSTFAGLKWQTAKNKAAQVTTLAKDVIDSIQDNKVTEEECQKIAADAKAVLEGLQ